jgi:hypothetical protein
MTFSVSGLARPKEKAWQILLKEQELFQKMEAQQETVLLVSFLDTDFGIIERSYQILFPKGVKNLQIQRTPPQILFQMPARLQQILPNPHTQVEMKVETKPYVISCAAKSYGYEKFDLLWVARSIFENKGNTPLHHYQVRFRLIDYTTSWSPWTRYPLVLPGQTVIDPYYPLLNIEKINLLEGRRQTLIETEYQYQHADGKVFQETESSKIELLGKNEVVFTSFPLDFCKNFYDIDNLSWLVLASLSSKDDPAIQQTAAMVSGMEKVHLSTSLKDEAALKFMGNLIHFMHHNKIAYQTPPGDRIDKSFIQHVKYGREVLRNRAGTCIDLAILYASICEAVGLKTALYSLPEHCFPAVYLPESKELIPVETTSVARSEKFEDARAGSQQWIKALEAGKPFNLVRIKEQRSSGVYSMELPPVSDTWLKDLGYTIPSTSSSPPNYTMNGTWIAAIVFQNVSYNTESTFYPNGTTSFLLKNLSGQIVLQGGGAYRYQNGIYHFSGGGLEEQAQIQWLDANHFIYKVVQTNNPNVRIGTETLNTRK